MYHWYILIISIGENMDIAQVFKTGRSQAVRLPKEYRFTDSEVTVQHFAGGVLLLPKKSLYDAMSSSLEAFEQDFRLVREQPEDQKRVELLP
jgi:antitoxin VapB